PRRVRNRAGRKGAMAGRGSRATHGLPRAAAGPAAASATGPEPAWLYASGTTSSGCSWRKPAYAERNAANASTRDAGEVGARHPIEQSGALVVQKQGRRRARFGSLFYTRVPGPDPCQDRPRAPVGVRHRGPASQGRGTLGQPGGDLRLGAERVVALVPRPRR